MARITGHDGDDYDQGTWERIKPEPKKFAGRKPPHEFLDVAAFGRLVKKFSRPDGTIDARPQDVREDDGLPS